MTDKQFTYILEKLLFDLECVVDNYEFRIPHPDDDTEMLVVSSAEMLGRLHFYFGKLIDVVEKEDII